MSVMKKLASMICEYSEQDIVSTSLKEFSAYYIAFRMLTIFQTEVSMIIRVNFN